MGNSKDPFDLVDVPTVAEYRSAFLVCRPALKSRAGSSLALEMLRANYYAPDHTLTAGELARAVGLADYSAANLRYGTYAKALCEALGRSPDINIAILVRFGGGQPNSEFVQWIMLPEVAAALEALGWVRPERMKAGP